jgi:hypothetical protein
MRTIEIALVSGWVGIKSPNPTVETVTIKRYEESNHESPSIS